jgi:hypothetical protein
MKRYTRPEMVAIHVDFPINLANLLNERATSLSESRASLVRKYIRDGLAADGQTLATQPSIIAAISA